MGYIYLNSSKDIGLLYAFNDKVFSIVYVFTAVTPVISGFLINYIWNNFGPRITMYLIITFL